jgi:hypothetical protein
MHLVSPAYTGVQSRHDNVFRIGSAYHCGRMRRNYELVLTIIRQNFDQFPNRSRVEEALRFIDENDTRKWSVYCHVQNGEYLPDPSAALVKRYGDVLSLAPGVVRPDDDLDCIVRHWPYSDLLHLWKNLMDKSVELHEANGVLLQTVQNFGQIRRVGGQMSVRPEPAFPNVEPFRRCAW